MIIICGKSIDEVEKNLEMAKLAIASGAPIGVGGSTMEDVESGLNMLVQMLDTANAPISNPNYTSCPCGCCDCEEEEEEEENDPLIEWLRSCGAPASILRYASTLV